MRLSPLSLCLVLSLGSLQAQSTPLLTDATCSARQTAFQKATDSLKTCQKTPPSDDQGCAVAGKAVTTATADLGTCPAPKSTETSDDLTTKVAKIEDELARRKDSDFELQLGIGSLIRNGTYSDYAINSNVLSTSGLGKATPQYLVGVGLRTPIPNFKHLGPNKDECKAARMLRTGQLTQDAATRANSQGCPYYREKPFSGFLSLKFSPQSSSSIVGYVLGGSYSAGHYLNILMGFGLTPASEPSHGLRVAASQYVLAQQKLGVLMNYDANALLNDNNNAFDGFSLLDSSGKLLYNGTPLEPHYRGGFIVGVAIPINFADFLHGQ